MAQRTIEHHLSCWPIVVSNIYGQEHSEQDLREAYAAWTSFMHRGPHVLIMDMTAGTAGATAAQRAKVAEWIEANEALLRSQKQLAHIMVVNSAVVRGIITAVFWLRPPANPHHVVASVDEAVDRAASVLQQAGITVPADRIARARLLGSRQQRPQMNTGTLG
jgi:hypothetical protein